MASRYRDSRYDGDRRSRSPRDRSPGRFERGPQFADNDRRRSSAEGRANVSSFQSNRDSFDPSRREPPRGPKALIDSPGGSRGGFSVDFRGGSRGRGGRGRPWGGRDDSRERDMDFRGDRYRDERSRERERDRDRDREWRDRDNRDFRSRRSPLRVRSPPPLRDFRDRDRDGPLGVDADRARRDSRDGGPLSAGSSTSDPPPYGGPPFARGGGMMRGRGRGGRGDWSSDRGRGRTPYDDRYPRSRSQEGRWARERDDRDRGDRYPEADVRRDPRDERDRPERPDLIRPKLEQRSTMPVETAAPAKEVSPPPVAPSAPAFGSVPNRSTNIDSSTALTSSGRAPPTGPKALTERPGSSGHDLILSPPTGPSKSTFPDNASIPVGPRAQQQQKQRPSSKQWINPALKKPPESPKMMRAQTFAPSRPDPYRRGSSAQRELPPDRRRPRSSDAKSDGYGPGERARSHHSAEPGEIRSSADKDEFPRRPSMEESTRPEKIPREDEKMADVTQSPKDSDVKSSIQEPPKVKTKRRRHHVGVVQFSLPTEPAVPDQGSESDDDEGLGDYFTMEIEKTQAELNKIEGPKVPTEVLRRYAILTHGSMVKVLKEKEGLVDMLGPLPEGVELPGKTVKKEQKDKTSTRQKSEVPDAEAAKLTETTKPKVAEPEAVAEDEAMDLDVPPPKPLRVPPIREARAASRGKTPRSTAGSEKASPLIAHQERPTQLASVPIESTETESKPPSTPSQVEDDESSTDDETYLAEVENVREYMTTPPIDSLPNFNEGPWDKDQDPLSSMDSDAVVDDFVVKHMDQLHIERRKAQNELRAQFADNYLRYLDFTTSEDPIAVKSRGKFSVAAPPIEPPAPVTPEPKPEGRGGGRRFATERDLERVLQASMREDEERKEREMRAQQEKYRSDKEAVIPPMIWDKEEKESQQFLDRTGYVPPDRLVSAWQVLPPVNNFTEEENELFEKRYLELPKQWGKVAEVLPNRDFGTCIQYYYLMKKNLNLKEKLKKQPKRRKKGRKGGRSSALVSELGNADGEVEDTTETGENGERRRPRRAAAPVWPFEQPATDTENITPAGTPGRRGQSAKGENGEKIDGRKGKRKLAKDKEAKAAKVNQNLAAAPGPAGRGRSRPPSRAQNPEGQTPPGQDVHRLPTQFEESAAAVPPPPFVGQPPMQPMDRQQLLPTTSMPEVMTAPPLRPEPPPPQPAMTASFSLTQPQQDRKPPSQASSYWSVSESNDFPHLLRSFGSDWNAIAAHMGSKTSIMVKNYFVRQKDQGRAAWENIVREADQARARGEKLPEPPQPSATGRERRRYDGVAPTPGRPIAVAGAMELHGDPAQPPRLEPGAPVPRGQPFGAYNAPMGQPGQPPPMSQAPPGQQPIAMQPQGPPSQPVSSAMSPGSRPLRAPLQGFGFPEREREGGQRQPLPLKGPVTDGRDPRDPHPQAAPTMPPAQGDGILERQRDSQMLRLQQAQIDSHRQQQQQQQQQGRREREREMDMARQNERPPLRVKQESEGPPPGPHGFESFGHRQQQGLAPASREPLPLAGRPPQEPPRGPVPQAYPPPMQPQANRGLLSNPSPAQSPPVPPTSRQGPPPLHQGPPSGPPHDPYSNTPPQTAVPQPQPAAPRPPEARKTSSIMSLLNDDPPPAPKRVSDVNNGPARPSPTPPPQGMGRQPPPGPGPQSHMRRESDQYPPYGRSSGVSAMPSLKPTYSASPQSHPMGGTRTPLGGPMDSPASDRDYYRQSPFPHSGHQSTGSTGSPQNAQRYPPPSQPQHFSQPGYPTSFAGSGPPPPHASSPPPQYSVHATAPRTREVPQNGRESWPGPQQQQPPPQQHQGPPPPQQQQQQQQQPGSWQNQPPKTSQPPPQQNWAPQGPPTSKPATPAGGWASAPPPPPHQQHSMGMRDDRGPPMYAPGGPGSMPPQQQQGQQQHPMSNRYSQPPPTSRPPEQVPPPAQAYRGYASTPGPQPRDPRDMPGRSYTPAGYDGRGPPPPQGPPQQQQGQAQGQQQQPGPPLGPGGYAGPDPRDAQLRDSRDPRDPRDMMGRSLRPHEYDRHPDYHRR